MVYHSKLVVVSVLMAIFFAQFLLVSSKELEREFSYDEDSEVGPKHWGKIHEDWAACGEGRMQSPIDLAHERVQILPHLGRLRRQYLPARAVLKNRGHDITLQWEEEAAAGALWINGTAYNLKQLHWHSPSEHTINGRRYSVEMHMVHQSAERKLAVVSSLYQIGGRNDFDPFLRELEKHIKKIEGSSNDREEAVGLVNPNHIKHGAWKYYRYMGSLTSPPCTEGVVWTIMRKVKKVSKGQLELLRTAVGDGFEMNARPTQKINDRMIDLFM